MTATTVSGTATAAETPNSSAYLPSWAAGPPAHDDTALPTNSAAAKKATLVPLALGATVVIQVCSEECMNDHPTPSSSAVTPTVTRLTWMATSAYPAQRCAPPTAMSTAGDHVRDRRLTSLLNSHRPTP